MGRYGYRSVVYSKDVKWIGLGGIDGSAPARSVSGRVVKVIKAHKAQVTGWHSVATVSVASGMDKQVLLWDVQSGHCQARG